MLDINKAKNALKWIPRYTADTAVARTVAWYKAYYNNQDIIQFTIKQIKEYEGKIIKV